MLFSFSNQIPNPQVQTMSPGMVDVNWKILMIVFFDQTFKHSQITNTFCMITKC